MKRIAKTGTALLQQNKQFNRDTIALLHNMVTDAKEIGSSLLHDADSQEHYRVARLYKRVIKVLVVDQKGIKQQLGAAKTSRTVSKKHAKRIVMQHFEASNLVMA